MDITLNVGVNIFIFIGNTFSLFLYKLVSIHYIKLKLIIIYQEKKIKLIILFL